MSGDYGSLKSRFWSKVDKSAGPDGCWEWTARKDPIGRGEFHFERKTHRASRIALTISGTEIPPGMVVCHRCDNPGCVNPAHLFIGTQRDNLADMRRKGRGVPPIGRPDAAVRYSRQQVEEARRLWKLGGLTQVEIGRLVGMSSSNVCYIVNNKTRAAF